MGLASVTSNWLNILLWQRIFSLCLTLIVRFGLIFLKANIAISILGTLISLPIPLGFSNVFQILLIFSRPTFAFYLATLTI